MEQKDRSIESWKNMPIQSVDQRRKYVERLASVDKDISGFVESLQSLSGRLHELVNSARVTDSKSNRNVISTYTRANNDCDYVINREIPEMSARVSAILESVEEFAVFIADLVSEH